MEDHQWGRGGERLGENIQGIKWVIGRYKNRQREVKNSMGNGDAKELTCMTHGHELRWGNDDGVGVQGRWV